MKQLVKYSTMRRFGTDIHVLEFMPSKDLIVMNCAGDRKKREPLTKIRHKWFEDRGYKKVAAVNLSFFAWVKKVAAVGLDYTDSGFTFSTPDSIGKGFMETIFMNNKLIIEDISTAEFKAKYDRKAQWGASLSYRLTKDGEINLEGAEHHTHSNERHPRTLVGQRLDNTMLLVVAEGRNTNDKGLTAEESAEVMMELQAHNSVNADGGGSSEMEVDGKVVNYLNGGVERNIANALVIYAKEYKIDYVDNHMEKINKKVQIIATRLNIREGSGVQYDDVGDYFKGDIVTVTGVANGWYRTDKNQFISANKAYVRDYVKVIPKPVEEETQKGIVTGTSVLNIRGGKVVSSSNYKDCPIVDRLDRNEVVKVYEEKNGWYRIGEDKWTSGKYIKLVGSEDERFKVMTTAELIKYCQQFKWTRTPRELHVHHTWSPSHKHFTGTNHQSLQQGMWNYHVNTLKWRDIGQHLSLAPDGKWIVGRDFNSNPASIKGRNYLGFAIEMIANFDKGNDTFSGPQKESMLEFTKYFNGLFNIKSVFHNEYSSKTCPGSSINKSEFLQDVAGFGVELTKEEVFIDWFNDFFKPNIKMDDVKFKTVKAKILEV